MTFDRFLKQVRRRLRLVSVLAEIQHWAPTVLAVSVVWILAIRLFRWPAATAVFPIGVGLVGLAGIWLRLRITADDAAVHSDRALRSGEFISSAVELDEADGPLAADVRRRAQTLVARTSPQAVVPLRWYPNKLLASAFLVAAAAALAVWPGLGVGIGLSEAEQQLVDQEAANLEALIEAVEEAEIPDDRKLDLTQDLKQLLNDLASVNNLDEAEAAITDLQSELESEVGDDHLSEKAAVQGLERELQQAPLASEGTDAASQLAGLAEALANGELTEAEQQELAERLEALAESQQAGNPEVSEALAAASAGLRSGNLSQAQQELARAAQAQQAARDGVRRDAANTAVGAALSNAAARLQAGARAQLAAQPRPGSGQASRNYNLGLGQGQGAGQGQGQGAGQGSGQGQGAGQGQGSGGQGTGGQGGAGAGPIAGVAASGQEQAGQGGQGTVGQGDPSDIDGMDVERATVYDYQPPDAAGVDLQVYLDGGSGDGSVVGRADTVTERGQSVVPFSDVLPEYLDQVSQALEDGELPPATRSTVRRYFDGLAQEANQQ